MGIFKKYQRNKFTQVDNAVINRKDLSAKAKGILLYLMSKPEDWSPNIGDIQKHMTDGRDGLRTGMHELVAKGYAILGHTQDEAGKLTGSYWQVADTPIFLDAEFRESRESENPTVGESNTTKTVLPNTDFTNKETPPTPQGELEVGTPLDEWWDLIPSARKVDKKAVAEKWARLKEEERQAILQHWPAYVRQVMESKNRAPGWEQFVRHPKTYLNNRNWEDADMAQVNGSASRMEESVKRSQESLAILDQMNQ